MSAWTPLTTIRENVRSRTTLRGVHKADQDRAAAGHADQTARLAQLNQAQEVLIGTTLLMTKGENAALAILKAEIAETETKLSKLSRQVNDLQAKIDDVEAEIATNEKYIAAIEAAGLG